DVLGIAAWPLETGDTVRGLDDAVRQCLHHDPVDVRDLVVASIDGVERPDACRDVTVDVQAELVGLADGGGKPLRVEGAVELYADEAVGFRGSDQRDRLRFAGRDVCDLGGVRSLAV